MRNTVVRLFVVVLGLAGALQAHAGYDQALGPRLKCEIELKPSFTADYVAVLRQAITADAALLDGAQQVTTMDTIGQLAANTADTSLAGLFSGNTRHMAELLMQINSYEEPVYQNALNKIILTVHAGTGRLASENAREHLRRLMTERLVPFFTQADAQTRVNAYVDGNGTLASALGELNEAQVFHHVYGESPEHPSPDSLIGRYLTEVQQTMNIQVATEWRSFFATPTGTDLGTPRLYAAMSDGMLPIIKKYFFNHYFMFQAHQSGQGTLMVSFNGESFSYAGSSRSGETRSQGLNSFWPMIVLTSKEGNRMQAYFDLGKKTVGGMNLASVSKLPWTMGSAAAGSNVLANQYVATGAYSCCTHWFGDIPFGERLVSRYLFPSAVDNSATHNPNDHSRRESAIGDNSKILSGTTVVDTPALMQVVWKQGQGNMQLWEVLGLDREQAGAELTNPGYISYAMLSAVPNRRVPIVFVNNPNNQLPTNGDLKSTISYR